MPNNSQDALEYFKNKIDICFADNSQFVVDRIESDAVLILTWTQYLEANRSNHFADNLIRSVRSEVIEAAGYLSIGLVRPALYALRLQIESMLAWVYFNDHKVEWLHTINTDHDFPMRAQNLKYLSTFSARYSARFKLLEEARTRKVKEPYALLCTHVHATCIPAMPSYADFGALVNSKSEISDCIDLVAAVSEYLSDVLSAWYADAWHDFPPVIKSRIEARLGQSDLKKFCV
ncbi:hypothetical protein MSC49_14380 [Methylosinus sp. C49]|nr:hypothetical protein MSC49_14380 [Methylosinus sp. C49]